MERPASSDHITPHSYPRTMVYQQPQPPNPYGMEPWVMPPPTPYGWAPAPQGPMLGDGSFTRTVRHSAFKILVDTGLIWLGVKYLQHERALRRERARLSTGGAGVLDRRSTSPAYQLYDSGVATVQQLVGTALSGAFPVEDAEFAALQRLQRVCHSVAGRDAASSFSREEFSLIRRWLVRVLNAGDALAPSAKRSYRLLFDLVDLSLSSEMGPAQAQRRFS